MKEFWIVDATDNSGYHVIPKPKGEHLACNVFHVVEYSQLASSNARAARYEKALQDIAKKVPHKVSVYEAADMACEFQLGASDALAYDSEIKKA